MRPTYLINAGGGKHIVYTEDDLKRCVKDGWRLWEIQPDGGQLPEPVVASVEAAPVEKKKPGRPRKAA